MYNIFSFCGGRLAWYPACLFVCVIVPFYTIFLFLKVNALGLGARRLRRTVGALASPAPRTPTHK